MKTGTIYGLVCPIENRVVYIGKTTKSNLNARLNEHKRSSVKSIMEWIGSLGNESSNIKIVVIENNIPIQLLNGRENYWIDNHGGYLLNTRKSVSVTKPAKNEELQSKIIHLDSEVIRLLTILGAKQIPIQTAKEVIQNLAINYAKK